MALKKMVFVDSLVVSYISSSLVSQKSEELMQKFGISYNTWVKMKKGEPLRASVAQRLLGRISAKGGEAGAHSVRA